MSLILFLTISVTLILTNDVIPLRQCHGSFGSLALEIYIYIKNTGLISIII